MTTAILKRFRAKVRKTRGCWHWTASRDHSGKAYGKFRVGKKILSAHRLAYEHENGPIPDGVLVLHDCDNKACVNPAHLHLGDQAQNMREYRERGPFGFDRRETTLIALSKILADVNAE